MSAMASSGKGDRPLSVFDELELAAAAAAAAAKAKAERARSPLHSLDYPCTARFRLRRLLAYLRGHGYAGVYEAARASMPVIFHVKDLVKKVKAGQWREACYFINRFVNMHESGYELRLLMLFLQDLMAFNDFSNGRVMVAGYLCDWFTSIYKTPMLDKYPCFATLVTDVLFMRSDHARAFLDWEPIRRKAAKIIEKMAYETPEFRDRMHYPRGWNNLYHAVPIGSRRHKKNVGRKQSTNLAQFYLQTRKRLPSSQEAGHSYSGLATIRGEPLIALLETSLEAGRRPVQEQVQPPEHLSEGFPLARAKRAAGFRGYTIRSQGIQPELSSKLDTSQGPAVMFSRETNSANKRPCFQESRRDTLHPENGPKRSRTTGNFGEDQSSKFKAPHPLSMKEETA